ncbi:hypothetical protein ABGV40_14880 [Paenibacillus amylolyticus]|uniref:hypothetical protein n=1 Tax=Paenibacillus amylolyticus TaxID=1451 RepID=UPI003242459B
MGTVILQMQEAAFWRCTPRKLFALWKVHKRVNGLGEQEDPVASAAQQRWIDQYM